MSKQAVFYSTETLQVVSQQIKDRLEEAEHKSQQSRKWAHQLSTTMDLILLLPQPAALIWGADRKIVPNAAFLLLFELPAGSVNEPARVVLKHRRSFLHLLEAAFRELEYKNGSIYTACATFLPQVPGSPTHLSATPVLGETGRISGIAVLLHNTPYPAAPENTFFHSGLAILDQLPLSLYLFNKEGVLFYCNKRALAELQELLGNTIPAGSNLQSMLKQVIKKARYEDEQGRNLKYTDTPAFLALRNYREEMMVIRRRLKSSGEVRWFVSIAAPVLDMDGSPHLIVAINADVTKRENASLQIRHIHNHLKEHAADLATLIDNQHLLLSRTEKELADTSSDLQQFIHAASHDLKEPMRKIRTYASRLQQELKGTLSKNHLEQLGRIQAAASRLTDIIEGVQVYTRLTEQKPSYEAVNLNQLLNTLTIDLETTIQQAGAAIQIERLPIVGGIPELLYQLFYNLIINALKFRRAGVPLQVTITGSVYPEYAPFYSLITIQDNGIGFNNQYSANIFDPFVRLHSKDRFNGAGLGLAVCRKIIQYHEGHIEASSEEGKGTMIRIYLPLSTEKTVSEN